MPLVSCPECAKQISSAATHCIGCGHPMGLVATASAPPARTYSPIAAGSGFPPCQRCGSGDYKKLSVVHAGGVSLTEGSVSGVGIGFSGGLGVGVGKTTGVNQTMLSAAAAPPEAKRVKPLYVVGLFIVSSMISSTASMTVGDSDSAGATLSPLIACLLFAVITWLYVRYTRGYNRSVYAPALQRWERSYMCQRCGSIAEIQT